MYKIYPSTKPTYKAGRYKKRPQSKPRPNIDFMPEQQAFISHADIYESTGYGNQFTGEVSYDNQ